MGRNKKKYGICYLCGKTGKLTRDHVPPECFAPNPLEQFTITSTSRFRYAWACDPCNHSYSSLEKHFKNLMLLEADENIQAADDAWNKVISENEKSIEEHGIPSKTIRDILENRVLVDTFTPSGVYQRSIKRFKGFKKSRSAKSSCKNC